jgi:hypothetical protein
VAFILHEADAVPRQQRPQPEPGLRFELQEKAQLVLLVRVGRQPQPPLGQAFAEHFGRMQLADAGQALLLVHSRRAGVASFAVSAGQTPVSGT